MLVALALRPSAQAADAASKQADISAAVSPDEASFNIQAHIKSSGDGRDAAVYGAVIQHAIHASIDRLQHAVQVKTDAIQGSIREVVLAVAGDGDIRAVAGEGIEDWSVRQAPGAGRFLVVRLKKSDAPVRTFSCQVQAETPVKDSTKPVAALTFTLAQPTLAAGYVRIDTEAGIDAQVRTPTGLVPVEVRLLPETFKPLANGTPGLAYRFLGTPYSLPIELNPVDPEARRVVLSNFRLAGQMSGETASFTLTATARVKNPAGGSLNLLNGAAALTELAATPDWRLRFENGGYVANFDKAGEFPVRIQFHAAVRVTNGWNQVDFTVAPSSLQPVVFQGLKPDTQFRFAGAARPERAGTEFTSFLPPDGRVSLAWKESRAESEGTLFFSVEELAQVTVSPGVMRQSVVLDYKVMQGELGRVVLRVRGSGEVTRVQGPQVLSWNAEPIAGSTDRRLTVQLNQAQKDRVSLLVQTQTPLGTFPLATDVLRLVPEEATRFGGHYRVVNDGAVRLEVLDAVGLSQISPEQFPVTDATRNLFAATGTQAFVYRFSGESFSMRVQADNILPEIGVSQVVAYRLGETELSIDAEIELDVREAPLRELTLRIPRGFAVARLNASGLSDYFLSEPAAQTNSQLRLVYGTPVNGRQVVQVRLERNASLGTTAWALPRIDVEKARSVRGHVGILADAGFRLTPAATSGLTEIATAYFPRKMPGIQAAFRVSDGSWQASMNVDRLPQSIQADALHLFSVGEGIAYGSTLVNYVISGAPVASFRLALTNEYFNVEFTGRDVRNWQKVDGGYLVQLHTPVAGPYTLLATYERPFKAQGETLLFNGAQPLGVQSEQGHTIVVSSHQFQVRTVAVSPGLVALEPAEVPAEYRLFFDAPILAAYRYSTRPFNLQLALQPLAQGDTISQVIDRAALTTRISKDGQVVTDARYFVKNKGAPNLGLSLPADAELWSVTVNGITVVPVTAGKSRLIPLPQKSDPGAVHDLQIKIASKQAGARHLVIGAPILAAPILLADWRVLPESGQRLVFRRGSLLPEAGSVDESAFATLVRFWRVAPAARSWGSLGLVAVLLAIAAVVGRLATAEGVHRFSARHALGGVLVAVAVVFAAIHFVRLAGWVDGYQITRSDDLRFVSAVQQAESALQLEVSNLPTKTSIFGWFARCWPAAAAAALALYSLVAFDGFRRHIGLAVAWLLAFWTALRLERGALAFFALLAVFLLVRLAVPWVRAWWSAPPRPPTPPPSAPDVGTNPAAAAVALLLLFGSVVVAPAHLQAQQVGDGTGTNRIGTLGRAEVVAQQVRVEDDHAFVTARVRWQAARGQRLPLLHAPGVLTRINVPAESARLVQLSLDGRQHQALVAEKAGMVEVEFEYQLPVTTRDAERGFAVPASHGLVNRLTVALAGIDADLTCTHAVSIMSPPPGSGTNAPFTLVLAPVDDARISWKPRSRDTRREKAVFYADLQQLHVPGAGVIEGWHAVQIRPAQGELGELVFDVPEGLTITDVAGPVVQLWRFDPASRKLRVTLPPAQSRAFGIEIRSQSATTPLPFERTLGLLSVNGAAGQVGLVGIATGPEVQLDDAQAGTLLPINLEDFPNAVVDSARSRIAGLALRRAFRYSAVDGRVTLKASAVEPDIRVDAQQTLSLGEDRTVLAATLRAAITRAGIFRLSFPLPDGLEVESIAGEALSHWTELKSPSNRVVTLHLKSRTEGVQGFSVTLAGPGVRAATNWPVPRLALREAAKQVGQMVIVPEQGLRLQVGAREGLTQLDPVQAGIRQKGVVAFRIFQTDWRLGLDLERVDAWTQVNSLQHIAFEDARIRVTGNLQYEIENAGVKSLRIRLPAAAEGVRFRGEQVADFLPVTGPANAASRDWEVKLHRRFSGRYALQVHYTQPLADTATNVVLGGIEAQDINLQRGFVMIRSANRLQPRIDTLPAALQPGDAQSIPRLLLQDIRDLNASHTFRLVEPAFQLPVQLERHEAARLLPARVNSLTLTSVLSDDGVALTHAQLVLIPGDKQLLNLNLPEGARFWFAFVGRNSVRPWRESTQILIPLEQHSKTGEPVTVEFLYAARAGSKASSTSDLALPGPRFDLPLENIRWHVFLSSKWHVKKWSGSLELQDEAALNRPVALDLDGYIKAEAGAQKEQTREAEQFLSLGNSLLEKGDPEEARRAFQNAFGLSQHDNAFNEDARVQLHNLKTQQALVGLNVRQARVAGEDGALAAAPRNLRDGLATAYTQQEARQLIERNTAEDNAVQLRLVERLIQQQEALLASPGAIRVTVPELGRKLTFARSLQVQTNSDLQIRLSTSEAREASTPLRFAILGAIALGVAFIRRR